MGDPNVAAKFSQVGLIPNVVPTPPKFKLDVIYANNMDVGAALHPLDVRSAPRIEFKGEVLDGDYFSLLLIDPDYPKQESPTEAEFLHWLIPNINSDSMRRGHATGTRALVGYMPPTPIPASGQHRLTLLLFYHPKRKISQPSIKKRQKFSVKEFMQKHNFDAPLAGNFFVTQHDQ